MDKVDKTKSAIRAYVKLLVLLVGVDAAIAFVRAILAEVESVQGGAGSQSV